MNDFEPKTLTQSAQPPLGMETSSRFTAFTGFLRANRLYLGFIFFGLLIIGVLAVFAFRDAPVQPVKEANVSLTIFSPEDLPSGNDLIYRVVAKNEDNVNLTNLELELTYPEGVAFVESSPKPANLLGNIFQLPNLKPGQNLTVIVKTKAVGDINAEKVIQARLHYKYENFNSSFSKSASGTTRLTAAQINLEVEGPKEANTAQLVTYSVKYKNHSDTTIKNARIKINYPSGFNYASSEPSASLGGNIWNLGDVLGLSEGKITFQGTFNLSQPGETKTLEVEFLSLGDNGEFFRQNLVSVDTFLVNQPLLLTIENLNQEVSNVVNPGENLNFYVKYQNNGQVPASGVNIVVSLDSKAIELSSLKATGGLISGSTIAWNAAGVPSLESLNPGEQGSVNFSVSLKNPAVKDASKNLTLKLASKIKANEYSTFLPGETKEFKLSSPAYLVANLKYVSGSLPPKVGTQTKYKVSLNVFNSSNDFIDSDLSLFLPGSSAGFNQSSITVSEKNNVQFDPATGKLQWKLGVLPAHSGKFVPVKTLEFEVLANPTPSDVNNYLTLVRSIKFFAKDSFTEQSINLKTEDITSASLSGQGSYEYGLVIP
jgi:hypothetical protein